MQSETAEFRWNFREIRSRIRRTIFTKGLKPYLVLVLVVFIFSFIGILEFNSSGIINDLDMKYGRGIVKEDDILNILDYIRNTETMQSMPEIVRDEIAADIIRSSTITLSLMSFRISVLTDTSSFWH